MNQCRLVKKISRREAKATLHLCLLVSLRETKMKMS